MTEQYTPEDWKLLTAEALIERCMLHIRRIVELQREKAILGELLGSAQGELKRQQARIAEQEKAILFLGVDIDEYKKENHQLAADARKRIAELEAAQQWQPVTDEFGKEFGNYDPFGQKALDL